MRKKLLLVITGFCISIITQAQFNKGDKMAGATVFSGSFNSGKSEQEVTSIGSTSANVTRHSVLFTPAMGWFLNSRLVIGGTLNLSKAGQKTTYESPGGITFQQDKSSEFNIGLGAFARNYLGNSSSLIPFIQAGFNLGISNASKEGFFYGSSGPTAYKDTYDGSSSGGFFANAVFQGGFTKMVGEHTGLDLFLGYNFSYSKNKFNTTSLHDAGNDGSIETRSTNETLTKFTSHGIILGLGFQVFLRGKK